MELRKKLSIILIATILIQLISPIIGEIKFGQEVKATTTADGIFEYEVLEDGTISITGYRGTDTEVIIPETIEGKKVTSIGERAFSQCTELTTINIPANVGEIRATTFYGCSNLKEINVDKDNKNFYSIDGVLFNDIGDMYDSDEIVKYPEGKKEKTYVIPQGIGIVSAFAFGNAKNLEEVELSEVYLINRYAFVQCSNLKSISIPKKVTCIYNSTFANCSNLEKIELPEGLKKIEAGAFIQCSKLTHIEIPQSVTMIERLAFNGCSSLKNINIPENTELEMDKMSRMFNGCTSLESINVDENNSYYTSKDGILFSKDKTELIRCPEGKKEITSSILEGVIKIKEDAFLGCKYLISITIPNTVLEIEDCAFASCGNLERIEIPEEVITIGRLILSKCPNLKILVISADEKSWDYFSLLGLNDDCTIYTNKQSIVDYVYKVKCIFCESFPAVIEGEKQIKEGETYTPISPIIVGIGIENVELIKDGVKVEGYKSGDEINEVGEYKIIITEKSGNKTEVNFTIKAKIEKEIVSISVKQNPNKTKYYKGEELNTEGLVIEVKYNDGSTEEITEGYTCTPTKLDTIGEQEITVSYEGQTTTFKVTVEEKEIVITKEESKYETETIADKECITKIEPNTTIEEFKTNINDEYEVEVYNKDGEKETKEEEKIKTNMKIEIKKDGEKIAEYTLIVTGDVTGDGEANFTDILSINKHRLNRKQLGEIEEKAADVTGDGEVNFTDILKINKYRLGRIETL